VDLLILVVLGTQTQPFTRLLDSIENSKLNEPVLVQSVNTDYKSSKMTIVPFIPFAEMKGQMEMARFVITHGGTGSIIQALECNKKVVACARLKKYGEHIDDHQKELISAFAEAGYILELHEGESLDIIMSKIDSFVPKRFESNNTFFLERLNQSIDNFIELE
jgi:UDP-N-acetylglucosamine transferase subunit ALG13